MICWQMSKTSHKAKTSLGEFKVATPENSLINNQVVTSMRNLTTTMAYPHISTYSWTFTSIPNWTWSCSRLLSFVAQISNLWLIPLQGSHYMTSSSNLIDFCWLQSSSLYKWWRSRNTQNPKVHKRNSFSQCICSRSLFSCMMTFKISLIYN